MAVDFTSPLESLPDPLPLERLDRPFRVEITPPGSKSLMNRYVLLGALADGASRIRNALLDADDAQRMLAAVGALGASHRVEGGDLVIDGVGGRWPSPLAGETVDLFLNNAGTATRFLTAAAVLADPASHGIGIDGNARMRERPIGELVGLLRQLGAQVDELGEPGCVPLRVVAGERLAGEVSAGRTRSGQFISALLLVGAFLPGGLRVRLDHGVTTPSYVRMTCDVIERCGVGEVALDGSWEAGTPRAIRVSPVDGARSFDVALEPDASGATYFWAAAALVAGARCRVPGIGWDALQGDVALARALGQMGARVDADDGIEVTGGGLRGIEVDCSSIPDAAMTLAVACCFAEGVSVLRGLRTLRDKETDRLAALKTELEKIGAAISIESDGDDVSMVIDPVTELGDDDVVFDTYDDHRMAMSLALVSLNRDGVRIADPGCVAKTYAGFWRDWGRLAEGV